MDWNGVSTIIGSYGFPTLACIGLGVYVKHIIDQYMVYVDKMQDRYITEERHMMEVVNNNTLVIQRLCDKMGEDGIVIK